MQFYNLKTRSHVDIADDKVEKIKMERATKSGTQIRYAMTAELDGSKLFKFVNEAAYNESSAKEGKSAPKDDKADKKAPAKKAPAAAEKAPAKKAAPKADAKADDEKKAPAKKAAKK